MLDCNMSTIRLCGGQEDAAMSVILCCAKQ